MDIFSYEKLWNYPHSHSICSKLRLMLQKSEISIARETGTETKDLPSYSAKDVLCDSVVL